MQAYTTSCKLTKAPHLLFKTMHVKNKKKGEKEKGRVSPFPGPNPGTVEHITFTPLVLSATGGMANEATVFYKRLTSCLA